MLAQDKKGIEIIWIFDLFKTQYIEEIFDDSHGDDSGNPTL